MEQTIIYDFLTSDRDPLLQEIEDLKKDHSVDFEDMKISLNKVGLYEVSTDDTHECFSNMDKCYRWICEFLKDVSLSN